MYCTGAEKSTDCKVEFRRVPIVQGQFENRPLTAFEIVVRVLAKMAEELEPSVIF